MAFENGLKAQLHGFDFGQFGHEIYDRGLKDSSCASLTMATGPRAS